MSIFHSSEELLYPREHISADTIVVLTRNHPSALRFLYSLLYFLVRNQDMPQSKVISVIGMTMPIMIAILTLRPMHING